MPSSVSVVLPTYNESGHIVDLVKAVMNSIPSGWGYEVLVVDDNSPDGTYEIVKEAFANNPHVIPILRETDRGFAKSIRTGIERSSCEFLIGMDSDFTHDPVEIPKLLHVAQVYDLVSGSRFCPGGRMQDTPHYIASMLYNWLLRLIVRTQIQDNLGGYWLTRAELVKKLPMDQIFFGYGEYYFRMLHYLQHEGATIVEVPARYMARKTGNSKSRFVRMLFSYTVAALKLRMQVRKSLAAHRGRSS
jgi:dolichol-phosphate mannosyltransferase